MHDIKRWVDEGRSDEWIASALGTSASSVQSFRSRNSIYRKGLGMKLANPVDYGPYEGVLELSGGPAETTGVWFDPTVADDPRWHNFWRQVDRVEVRLSPTKIVFISR